MKFALNDPKFLLNRSKFPAGEDRYRWHPDFPKFRVDIKPLEGNLSVRPLVVSVRQNSGKSDGAQYLIGVDFRLFPWQEDIKEQKISFDIYKAKIPHSHGGIAYHFPHARLENVWLEVKIHE